MNDLVLADQSSLILVESLPLDRNPAAVFLASVSVSSRRVYSSDLTQISTWLTGDSDLLACNWAALRFQHTQAVRSWLVSLISDRTGEPLASATVNRMLCALRGVLEAAWNLGQMDSDDYHRARNVKSVTGENLPAGRELTKDELQALARICANDLGPAGVRDNAILALLYTCGLRRAELVALDLVDCEHRLDLADYRLTVRGKRNKERTAFVEYGAARALTAWLRVRGHDAGPLFMAISKTGALRKHGHLTTQTIYNILKRRAEQAGVDRFSPHDLRRSFVSDLLAAGVDISTVSRMAGHESVVTTARYDRRGELAKKAAACLLTYPNFATSGA